MPESNKANASTCPDWVESGRAGDDPNADIDHFAPKKHVLDEGDHYEGLAMMLAASFHSETGHTLYSKCEGQAPDMRGACIGYIEGMSDEIQVMQRAGY